MTKSLNNIVYSIKEELSGYNITDDNLFNNEYLIDKINDVREVLIKEAFAQGGIDGVFFNTIKDIEVQKETVSGWKTDSSLKSRYFIDIPDLILSVGWSNVLYLGGSDLMSPFARRTPEAYHSSAGAIWTANYPIYSIINNKAFVKGEGIDDDTQESGIFLSMTCLLKDPRHYPGFHMDNTMYPVPVVHKLEMLVKKDIMSLYGVMGDVLQDSRDIKSVIGEANKQQRNE